MPAGRPPKYNPKTVERCEHYIANYKTDDDIGDEVPTVAGLSVYLGVSRETIYAWAKDEDKPEFSDIVPILMGNQEHRLVNGSLSGELNPTISKLLLTKHGHSERVDNTHAGPDGKPIEIDAHWQIEVVGE